MAFWQIFQKAANNIEAWDFSPEVKKLIDEEWHNLPKQVQDGIWGIVNGINKNYGSDLAQSIFNSLIQSIVNALKG